MPIIIAPLIDDFEADSFETPFPYVNFPCPDATPLIVVTVISVSPPGGALAGGYTVDVWGTNFSTGAKVNFGGIPASSVSVLNSGHLTCIVPEGMVPDFVNVSVQCGFDYGILYNGFQYLS